MIARNSARSPANCRRTAHACRTDTLAAGGVTIATIDSTGTTGAR
jgi:hypothetical protein